MLNIEIFKNFVRILHTRGIKFGIDNFTLSESYEYLYTMKPSYIKIDKNVLIDLLKDTNSGVFNSLDTIIKALDIKIIATAIENDEQREHLLANKIVNMQGQYIHDTNLMDW